MKILCFHPALAPYRVDFFNLLAERAELRVLFLQKNLMNQKFDQASLRARLRCRYGELSKGFDIKNRCFRFGIRKAIKEDRPEVVLAYEASPVTLILILYKKLFFRSLSIWTFMDDSPAQIRTRKGLRRVIRDWVLRNVDKVIVPSQQAADAYQLTTNDYPLSTKRVAVVPIIHDANSMRRNASEVYSLGKAWRQENCPESWERMIVFVGRLAEVKNLPWLIDRMAELPETIGLVMVGDGPLESELKTRVQKMNLKGRVVFTGRKEGNGVYAIMAASDALVLVSTSEPFGAVVAEGLGWGTPCIVSDNCGAATLIENGVNGWVFKYGDKEGFLGAMRDLPPRSGKSILNVELVSFIDSMIGVA